MTSSRKRAFTLVEMMAVVVIIGILAAVIAPKFFSQVGVAQEVRAKRDISSIKDAVTMFRFHTNKFPTELRELNDGQDIKGWKGPYLDKKKPRDPWDTEYRYSVPGQGDREFDIVSMGPDGQEGTDDDVNSWEEDTD